MNNYPSENSSYIPEDNLQLPNRFIYVKQNFTPKVLINPHFKKTVYINPQFQTKPKIHVNPNVLRSLLSTTSKQCETPKTPQKTVVATRTKLIRVPESSAINNIKFKKRRMSLHTKYKIIRNNETFKLSPIKNCVNKFKLDKRHKTAIKTSNNRKKYVYFNRFLSISLMAKSVLFKQNKKLAKPGFVNINGILYKKSPNSLKKAQETSKKVTSKSKQEERKSLIKRYKIIRSKKMQKNKLKTCNMPCPVFRKFGKCKGKDNGTCIKLHNPNQIVLCTKFLQGACLETNCLLSHKVSAEKMPTCKYYLEGLCSKDDCPYLHVKISPKAEICRDFLEGFCKLGAQCDKRHQFLCPIYEKNGTCPKRKCAYPHGQRKNVVRKKLVAKKCSQTRNRLKIITETNDCEKFNNRYYCDLENNSNLDEVNLRKGTNGFRPKLGDLPAFIPLLNDL